MLLRYAEVLKELKVHEVWLLLTSNLWIESRLGRCFCLGDHMACAVGLAGCDLDSSYGLMTQSSTYLVGGLEHFWFLLMFPYGRFSKMLVRNF